MVMRLIDGQFPEYQRVIPKEGERKVKIPRVRFSEALKRIALLSVGQVERGEDRPHHQPAAHQLAEPGPGRGQGRPRGPYDGGDITIGFNARYLTDVLAVLETDEVAFELGDEHSPGVLHAPGDRSYTAVVMPMRV